MKHKSKWEKIVSRNASLLHWDGASRIKGEGLLLGNIHWKTNSDLVVKYNSPLPNVYADFNDPEPSKTNFKKYIEKENPHLEKSLNQAIEVIETDLKLNPGKTLKDVRHLYERYRYNCGLMIMAQVWTWLAEKHLSSEFENKSTWQQIKDTNFYPHKETLLTQEYEAIAQLQAEYKNQPDSWLRNKTDKLAHEFGFIHAEYLGQHRRSDSYKEAILGQPINVTKQDKPDLGEQDLTAYQKWLLKNIQKIIYIFEQGKTSLTRASWAMRETITSLGFSESHILYHTEPEFYQWCTTGESVPLALAEKRQNYFGILRVGKDCTYFSGKSEVESLLKQEQVSLGDKLENVNEIKGTIATKGIVRGKVRLVFKQSDLVKIKKGDVMVSPMTTPELSSGMQRAGAFVTDEGGATSHAAIVAREMDKPCIVGTKIATQVLKDGDEVEVDANNGVVKVLDSELK